MFFTTSSRNTCFHFFNLRYANTFQNYFSTKIVFRRMFAWLMGLPVCHTQLWWLLLAHGFSPNLDFLALVKAWSNPESSRLKFMCTSSLKMWSWKLGEVVIAWMTSWWATIPKELTANIVASWLPWPTLVLYCGAVCIPAEHNYVKMMVSDS